MYPSWPQSPPALLMLSESVTGGPPLSGATRSDRPLMVKATWLPSGEKNGLKPFSVPAIGSGRSLSCSRSQSRVPPSATPM